MISLAAFTGYLFGAVFLAAADGASPSWTEADLAGTYLLEGQLWSALLRAAYWSITTMSTIGYGDIAPLSAAETLVTIGVLLLGTLLFPGVVASMVEIARERNASDAAFERVVGASRAFMRSWRFPRALVRRIAASRGGSSACLAFGGTCGHPTVVGLDGLRDCGGRASSDEERAAKQQQHRTVWDAGCCRLVVVRPAWYYSEGQGARRLGGSTCRVARHCRVPRAPRDRQGNGHAVVDSTNGRYRRHSRC